MAFNLLVVGVRVVNTIVSGYQPVRVQVVMVDQMEKERVPGLAQKLGKRIGVDWHVYHAGQGRYVERFMTLLPRIIA